MPGLFQALLMLLARSADSQRSRQVEFLHAENQMLRRWDDNLAFEDLGHLAHRFKIRNKKAELDEMIKQLNRGNN